MHNTLLAVEPRRYRPGDPPDYPTGEALLDRRLHPARFWVPERPMAVLGHAQDAGRELDLAATLRNGLPVYRRIGGGGAVILSPACFCVALRLRRRRGLAIPDYFRLGAGLMKRVVRRVSELELEEKGLSDLCAGDLKVAGCSSYMPRDFVLFLASVMVRDCIPLMEQYLRHPSREPGYRAGRSHAHFVTCLASCAPGSCGPEGYLAALEEEARLMADDLDWEDAGGPPAPST